MHINCRGCKHHHNAGHPKVSALAHYNDWCCKFSKKASKVINHCKLTKGKELKDDPVV